MALALFILLFGSYARGKAGRYSDYDLFIVAATLPPDYWERQSLLDQGKPAWVDVVAFTPSELEQILHRGLVLDALLDGLLLRGDEAAFRQWREKAGRYIERQGLRRTPWGYFRDVA
ncbi:MAG: nucleotidyltransferase domain-containing protein [Chloroflexia bacterium]